MNEEWIARKYRYRPIQGRYVTPEKIDRFLRCLSLDFKVAVVGTSVQGRAIKAVVVGSGKTKLMMWSQMHGNESTTTKAVVDFLNFLNSKEKTALLLRDYFTFLIVPLVNPDGAKAYTRVNANKVDLNRDMLQLSQPESKMLQKLLTDFQPDFAFNLHDQRTIFGVGDTGKPATISFLAPSFDEARSVSANRHQAMQLIAEINACVQTLIPGQVGRFDDSFNLNCVGDYFQSRGVVTILFEAGHYPEDYQREKTREVVLHAILGACRAIVDGSYKQNSVEEYLKLPENKKNFQDLLLKEVWCKKNGKKYSVFVQYEERLECKKIKFIPIVSSFCNKEFKFAHQMIDEKLFFLNFDVNPEECIGTNMFKSVDFRSIYVNEMLK